MILRGKSLGTEFEKNVADNVRLLAFYRTVYRASRQNAHPRVYDQRVIHSKSIQDTGNSI